MKLATQVLLQLQEFIDPEMEKFHQWQSKMRERGATVFRSSRNSVTERMECYALTNSSSSGRLIQSVDLYTNEVVYDADTYSQSMLGKSITSGTNETGIIVDESADFIYFANGHGSLIKLGKSEVHTIH